jgi:hypothetical protein
MNDTLSFLKSLKSRNIVLAYLGIIDDAVIEELCNRLEGIEKKPAGNKKIVQVLVECLQNVFYHSSVKNSEDSLFVVMKEKNNIKVVTGNTVSVTTIEALKSRIDEINSFTEEELKNHYREKLKTTSLSEKGGAGLGLIEIARKSGNKLSYHFEKINGQHSFFTLIVTV